MTNSTVPRTLISGPVLIHRESLTMALSLVILSEVLISIDTFEHAHSVFHVIFEETVVFCVTATHLSSNTIFLSALKASSVIGKVLLAFGPDMPVWILPLISPIEWTILEFIISLELRTPLYLTYHSY